MTRNSGRRYFPRFSLRWLMLFALISCLVFGWLGQRVTRARRESRALEEIVNLSPDATFSFWARVKAGNEPPGPKFLRSWFGDNLFGFVEALHVDAAFDNNETINNISDFRQLKRLTIAGNAWLTDLSVLAELDQLRELEIRNCEEALDLSPLFGSRKLESLELSLNGFEDHSGIAKIRNLKTLSIGHPYRGFSDWQWLGELESIEMLDLSSSRINQLPPLGKLKRLRILDLTFCSRLESSRPVADLENLVELSIGRGTPMQIIDEIEKLGKLQRLHLSPYKPLTDDELNAIRNRVPSVEVYQES